MAANKISSPPEGAKIEITDSKNAGLIFFDEAITFGTYNNIVHIALSAGRWLPVNDEVVMDAVVTAHLRTNIQGATSLKDALEKALLLAAPTPADKN